MATKTRVGNDLRLLHILSILLHCAYSVTSVFLFISIKQNMMSKKKKNNELSNDSFLGEKKTFLKGKLRSDDEIENMKKYEEEE